VTLDKGLLALPQYPEFAALLQKPVVLKPGGFLTVMEQCRALVTTGV
jgi:hypothetical protein